MVAPIRSSRKRAKPLTDDALRVARERELARRHTEVLERFKHEVEQAKRLASFQPVPDDADPVRAAEIADYNLKQQEELRKRMAESGKIQGLSQSEVDQVMREVFGKLNG